MQMLLVPAVKQRMRSVTNIQKITKAMKMVAASKMRVAQASTMKSRGLSTPMVKLLGDLPGELHGYLQILALWARLSKTCQALKAGSLHRSICR